MQALTLIINLDACQRQIQKDLKLKGHEMHMKIAVTLFAAYFLNVLLGAVTGSAILEDVGEMFVLMASTLFFVLAILKLEAIAKSEIKPTNNI